MARPCSPPRTTDDWRSASCARSELRRPAKQVDLPLVVRGEELRERTIGGIARERIASFGDRRVGDAQAALHSFYGRGSERIATLFERALQHVDASRES